MNIDLDEHFIETHQLTTGQCHVFAVALGQAYGRDYSIKVGIRKEFDEEGEFLGSSFSHAVVVIDGEDYDANGAGAIDAWEGLWDPEVFQDEDGWTSEFEWHEISNSPSIEDVVAFIRYTHDCTDPSPEVASVLKGQFRLLGMGEKMHL